MAEGKWKNFHGKKGRSGRKPLHIEVARLRTIEKAWAKADTVIDGMELKPQQANMVQAIVVKTIPDKVEHKVEASVLNIHKFSDLPEDQLIGILLGRDNGHQAEST